MGVGHTTVQRVWKEDGLKPHLTRTLKRSNDPKFAEKAVDVVEFDLDPPDHAVVLSVDHPGVQAAMRALEEAPSYWAASPRRDSARQEPADLSP